MTLTLDVDLADVDTYANGTPHEVFARLRRECPVYWNQRIDGGPGLWCITKYADVAAIGRDPVRFTSTRGVNITRMSEEEAAQRADSLLIFMDAPRHTRLRGLVNSTFTPRRAAELEPMIRAQAARAVDDIIEAGECDLYPVAARLPIAMICALLGVPEGDHHRVLDWTNRTFGSEDPEYSSGPEDTAAAFAEIFDYGLWLAAARRAEPTDDLMSALAHAQIDGEPITDLELTSLFFLFLGAGNDTTRTLILNAVSLLTGSERVWDELVANRSFLPNAVDEVLRLEPSARGMGRTATTDVDLRGVTVHAGDQIYMWYCSANRDEEVFADPDRLDLRRANSSKHLAFGGGPHFCSGAALARVQTRVMLDELLDRLPDLEHAGEAVYARATQFPSFKHLPVRFTPGLRRG